MDPSSRKSPAVFGPASGNLQRLTNINWVIFRLASLASYINYVHRHSWGLFRGFCFSRYR